MGLVSIAKSVTRDWCPLQTMGQYNYPHHYQLSDLVVSGENRTGVHSVQTVGHGTGVHCKQWDTGLVSIANSGTRDWCPLQTVGHGTGVH